MAVPPPPSEVLARLRAHRKAITFREDAQVKRMAKAWFGIERSLSDQMKLLAFEIQQRKDQGDVITEQLVSRLERWKILRSQIKEQSLRYAYGPALKDIMAEQAEFLKLGLEAARDAINLSNPLGVRFNHVPLDAFQDMVGFLGDGTPLQRLLKEAYPSAVEGVSKALLEGIALGINPEKVAYNMSKGMDLGLARITLIARTEQLRAWRTSTQKQYADSGVVIAQKRLAATDACLACLVSDGEIIPVGEVLTDHPRGRCTTIPVVAGAPEVQWEKGPDWFQRQPEEYQKEVMGDNMFQAWKAGKFDLSQLRSNQHNETWGSHPKTTPLSKLLGGKPPKIRTGEPPKALQQELDDLQQFRLEEANLNLSGEEWSRLVHEMNGFEIQDIAREGVRATSEVGTPAQIRSLKNYQGSGYDRINGRLRAIKKRGQTYIPGRDDNTAHDIDNLDRLFEKTPGLKRDIVLMRGVGQTYTEEILGQLRVGTVLSDAGFLSTTFERSIAQDFAGSAGMFFELHVPKGLRAILPYNRYESEFILPRGLEFRIIGVRKVFMNGRQRVVAVVKILKGQ